MGKQSRNGSDMRALFRKLKLAGCTWKHSHDGYKIYQDERLVGSMHRTMGDPHAMRNLLSDLRRQGVKIR